MMDNMETIVEIEAFIHEIGEKSNQNYFIAEKSWRPEFQLRGNGASLWSFFSRKPHLLIFTSDKLVIFDYESKKSEDKISHIPIKEIQYFQIEKLTPFLEYCISFTVDKKYYFYIDSIESLFNSTEFSYQNFRHLYSKKFNGLLK